MNDILLTNLFDKLKTTYSDIVRLNDRNIKARIPKKYFEKFENDELLISAINKGLSEETLKTLYIFIFEKINLEKISNSSTFTLIKPFIKDLKTLTPESLYDFLYSKNILDKSFTAEFKKTIIYERALEITVEKGNISFKTALKKAINELEDEEKFTQKLTTKGYSESFEGYIDIINSLIGFYLENELLYIARILKLITK